MKVFNFNKSNKIKVFILTIIITVIAIIFISIFFSYSIAPVTNQNNSSSNTSQTNSPGITSLPASSGTPNDENAVSSDYSKNKTDEFKNIKTVSGNPVNYKIFPYSKPDLYFTIDLTSDSVVLNTCSSRIRATEDERSSRQQILNETLKQLDLSDQNKFDYGIDPSC